MTICLVLADLTPDQQKSLLIWGFVLIAAVIVGSLFIMMLRRWLKELLVDATDDAGFSLSELRAMRDRGEITPEEYEQTRARVIAKVKAAANAPRPKKGTGLSEGEMGARDGASIIPSDIAPDAPTDDSAPGSPH